MEEKKQKASELGNEMKKMGANAEEKMKDLTDEEIENADLDIFHAVYQNTSDILELQEVKDLISNIENKIDPAAAGNLVALMVAISSNAAYGAVGLFNKHIITPVLNDLSKIMETEFSSTSIELSAVKDAVSVLRERIESVNSELTAIKISANLDKN